MPARPRSIVAVRHRKFAQAVAAGKDLKRAALEAGYSPRRAEQTGSELMRDPEIQEQVGKYLDKAGATLEKSARVIAEAHDATETKVFNGPAGIAYSEPLIDHPTRLRGAELALKARRILGRDEAPQQAASPTAVILAILEARTARGLEILPAQAERRA